MRWRFVSLLLVLGSMVAIGAAVAVASVGQGDQARKLQAAGALAGSPPRRGAEGPLLAVLGVLRRPQTRADVSKRLLNSGLLKYGGALHRFGTPVIRLIRLATVTPWGAEVFLVPLERTGKADRLEFLELSRRVGAGSCCAAASDIERYGLGSFGGEGRPHSGVLIVPDGVSKVTIFPPGEGGKRSPGSSAIVHNNTAVFEFRGALEDPFKYMIWYGPSGAVIEHRG
jgi:hypothetical protein